jgi:hypothetical protein
MVRVGRLHISFAGGDLLKKQIYRNCAEPTRKRPSLCGVAGQVKVGFRKSNGIDSIARRLLSRHAVRKAEISPESVE